MRTLKGWTNRLTLTEYFNLNIDIWQKSASMGDISNQCINFEEFWDVSLIRKDWRVWLGLIPKLKTKTVVKIIGNLLNDQVEACQMKAV